MAQGDPVKLTAAEICKGLALWGAGTLRDPNDLEALIEAAKALGNTDVEYHVEKANGETEVYSDPNGAAGMAIALAMSRGEAQIDVVVGSEKGARAYGGDDAVKAYREDPDASVFERIEVSVNNLGRIP